MLKVRSKWLLDVVSRFWVWVWRLTSSSQLSTNRPRHRLQLGSLEHRRTKVCIGRAKENTKKQMKKIERSTRVKYEYIVNLNWCDFNQFHSVHFITCFTWVYYLGISGISYAQDLKLASAVRSTTWPKHQKSRCRSRKIDGKMRSCAGIEHCLTCLQSLTCLTHGFGNRNPNKVCFCSWRPSWLVHLSILVRLSWICYLYLYPCFIKLLVLLHLVA